MSRRSEMPKGSPARGKKSEIKEKKINEDTEMNDANKR
jgi:hypothetical protein